MSNAQERAARDNFGSVKVPYGYRHRTRLTVADPAYELGPEGAYEVLAALGVLDDTTVPEEEEP